MPENPQAGALLRWEEHGAPWRVVERTPTSATVSLLTCDDGTEVDRLVSSDPEFLALVARKVDDPESGSV
ncbi:MAG TPA: hypothetical protein K8V84_25565 [Nocardiopsis listeri]|uniref:hypothetical protein n=1 Tax=Nocardiopsis listeri TaxID=53440 RepID=UPI001D6D6BCC|nr:hypothetical protein [Nocardiopsis listeri]HJE61852.1 hypothetical protein [Nocardiopsis listeri]